MGRRLGPDLNPGEGMEFFDPLDPRWDEAWERWASLTAEPEHWYAWQRIDWIDRMMAWPQSDAVLHLVTVVVVASLMTTLLIGALASG